MSNLCLKQDQGLKALAEHTSTQNICQCHSGYCLLHTWDFGCVGPLCCLLERKLRSTQGAFNLSYSRIRIRKSFVANLLCHNFWTT